MSLILHRYYQHMLGELTFYIPLNTKSVISETFPKPTSWLGMEKQTLTQQKHAFTNQKQCTTTTQNKHKKLKPGLVTSYDIRPGNREDLFLFRHFIICHLLTYLDTYPLAYSLSQWPRPTRDSSICTCLWPWEVQYTSLQQLHHKPHVLSDSQVNILANMCHIFPGMSFIAIVALY